MIIRFTCQMEEVRPNVYHPLIERIRNGVTGSFPCVWRLGIRTPNPANRLAIGTADVNATQLAAIQADLRIIIEQREHEDQGERDRLNSEIITYAKLRESS